VQGREGEVSWRNSPTARYRRGVSSACSALLFSAASQRRHPVEMQGPIFYIRRLFVLLIALCLVSFATESAAQDIAPTRASANPYDSEFQQLRADFAHSSAPQQAVLLARALELREYVDNAGNVRDWLAGVVGNDSLHALVRDHARAYLAMVDVSTRNLLSAEQRFAELGYVRDWKIAGPFGMADAGDAQIANADRNCQNEALAGSVTAGNWRHVGLGPQASLDLSNFISQRENAVVYAAACVHATSAQVVALRLSADSEVSAFVNGKPVLAHQQATGFSFDQHAAAVSLVPGRNSIVLRLSSKVDGPWRAAARITGVKGGGRILKGSVVQAQSDEISEAQLAGATVRVDDLVDMAADSVKADKGSAEKLETLGLIELIYGRGDAYEHLLAAAKAQPSAKRWLAVASACTESSCVLDALTAALRIDSSNANVKVALADYYLGRNQLEKTRDLLREAVKLAPGDFVSRNRLVDVYIAAGLNGRALEEARALQASYSQPLWVRKKLAARYADLGLLEEALSLAKGVLRDSFDDSSQRDLLARIYKRRLDRAGLEQAYREELMLNPHDAGALASLAEIQFATGEPATAEAKMQQALEINDGNDELRERYANLLDRAGRSEAAQTELARAVELNPYLDNARRRLELAGGNQRDSEQSHLEDPAKLAADADCTANSADTNAVGLADVRIERMYANGLSAVRVQQVLCIATEQGARDYASRSVQYSPASQQLRILHARVYKRNGRVLEGVEGRETGVADTAVAMYYDVRSREVRYPGLEKGDVVELDYRIMPTTNSNPYGDYFASLVFFCHNLPQSVKRYVLIAPSDRKLNVVEARMAVRAAVTHDAGQTIYRWESRNVPALLNEPRGPAVTETAPYVHVSTFRSWEEIGRWYADLVRPQFALDATLREVSARLTTKKMSEIEKINAVHQFVLRNTHYVALEFGIYSYKPYPVAQTYARRFGDCKDKASLMIALLRQAGIEANLALVRTRKLGEIDPRSTSIVVFDHAIVYVPKWDLWLDGTAEYAGSRELPLADQGAMALVVGLNGSSTLRRIPNTEPEDNFTRRTVRARVTGGGTVEFAGTAYTRGEEAPGLRREYEIPERRRDFFRSSLAEVLPSVRVDDVRVDGANDLERDVHVDFRGTLDTFAGKSVISLSPSWMKRFYVQTLAPVAIRQQDLLLPAPWITEEELRFELPAGASITSVPSDTNLATPFGSASIRYEKQGRELIVSTSVRFSKLRITPAEYGAFRQFCRDLERAFRQEAKVKLRG